MKKSKRELEIEKLYSYLKDKVGVTIKSRELWTLIKYKELEKTPRKRFEDNLLDHCCTYKIIKGKVKTEDSYLIESLLERTTKPHHKNTGNDNKKNKTGSQKNSLPFLTQGLLLNIIKVNSNEEGLFVKVNDREKRYLTSSDIAKLLGWTDGRNRMEMRKKQYIKNAIVELEKNRHIGISRSYTCNIFMQGENIRTGEIQYIDMNKYIEVEEVLFALYNETRSFVFDKYFKDNDGYKYKTKEAFFLYSTKEHQEQNDKLIISHFNDFLKERDIKISELKDNELVGIVWETMNIRITPMEDNTYNKFNHLDDYIFSVLVDLVFFMFTKGKVISRCILTSKNRNTYINSKLTNGLTKKEQKGYKSKIIKKFIEIILNERDVGYEKYRDMDYEDIMLEVYKDITGVEAQQEVLQVAKKKEFDSSKEPYCVDEIAEKIDEKELPF